MPNQDQRQLLKYRAELAERQAREYFDMCAVDPSDPDYVSLVEGMIDDHPDPYKSKKSLCADIGLSVDSLRKYNGGTYGPPFGLVERLMRLTGCYKPLYWLARRCGFILVPEQKAAPSWDNRRKVREPLEFQRLFNDIMNELLVLESRDSRGARKQRSTNKALRLLQELQEQAEGWKILIRNQDPQLDMFTTPEDQS